MKNSTFLPVLVFTAGAAFALGWIVRPGDSADSGEKDSSAKSATTRISSGPARRGAQSYRGGGAESAKVDEFLARYSSGGSISAEDMRAAIEEMRKENDPIVRRKMFTALLESLTPENAKDAYLAMREGRRGGFGFGRGGGNEDELRLLANAWGRIDGPGAVKALEEMRAEREAARGERGEGDRGRGRFGDRGGDRGGFGDMGDLVSVLSGWATVDGAGAANYVNSIEDERQQRIAAAGVVSGMMVNGVDEAMNYISSIPTGEEGNRARSFYTSMVASEMLEQGLDSAKDWVDSIRDPELRGGALSRVAESAVREDLESAVEWVTQYAGDESATRALGRIANEWAEDDPQAALQWADTLPDAARADAYGQAFREWTREDPTAAGEYLGNMPESTARDSAVETYASSVAWREPETAIQWAETISDAETRTETLTNVARAWVRRDREAASTWLEGSGLPAETVQSVLEAPERGGFDFRQRGGGGPGGGRGPGGGGRGGR